MWLVCTSHFGMRTGKECHDLCWGDVQLCLDAATGQEYLQYEIERQTKTRSGNQPRNTRVIKPKAWAAPENEQRCPVHLYKVFRDHRPEEMKMADSPFFLSAATHFQKRSFRAQPMGINKLYRIMSEMKEEAGITDDNITPYSSRKKMIRTLSDVGVPANQIVQVSGNKNMNSINNYSKINDAQSRNISAVLSDKQDNQLVPIGSAQFASHTAPQMMQPPHAYSSAIGSNRWHSLAQPPICRSCQRFPTHIRTISQLPRPRCHTPSQPPPPGHANDASASTGEWIAHRGFRTLPFSRPSDPKPGYKIRIDTDSPQHGQVATPALQTAPCAAVGQRQRLMNYP